MTGPDLDLLVVGDGPAGLALAAACRRRDVRVLVAGPGQPWTATYATWTDDVPELPAACYSRVSPAVVVHGRRRRVLERPYGVLDGAALAAHLGHGLERCTTTARAAQHFEWGTRLRTDDGDLDARVVVDATGRTGPSWSGPRQPPVAWQTAYGVVVDDPPIRFDADRPTFMDLRAVATADDRSTFCYVVPVADGWLVEETALAARPSVQPTVLAERLAARLGGDAAMVMAAARRVETVAIPLGGPQPSHHRAIVPFGAAAGFTNPVSGYSVAAALRAAPRVAGALEAALAQSPGGRPDVRAVHDAVWPRSQRRTRRLHDHGLRVLLRLAPTELAEFFDAFFDLPISEWSAYLRVDSSPTEVSRVMAGVLRRLPWRVRRRVLATAPWPRGAPGRASFARSA